MTQFTTFIKKEFYHVLRDRKTLLILFGMPVVQILIFGFALTNEVKNSKIVIVDEAKDEASAEIIGKIEASRYFEIEKVVANRQQIEAVFKEGKVKAALLFPANFSKDLQHQNKAQVQIIADATDQNIIADITIHVIVATSAVEHVITPITFKCVISTKPIQGVVPLFTIDGIRAIAARE